MKIINKHAIMAGVWFTAFETIFWNFSWHDFKNYNSTGIIYLIISAICFMLFIQAVFNGIKENETH